MKRHKGNCITRFSWLVLGLLISALPAWSASFDCGKASTEVEKMICQTPLLSQADEALSSLYRKLLRENSSKSERLELKYSQRAWLVERDNCHYLDCIILAYQMRGDTLRAMTSSILPIDHSASFDCRLVDIEAADLCPHGQLTKMAEEIDVAFGQVLARTSDPDLLMAEQRVWLQVRDHAVTSGPTWGIILDLYRDRAENLQYELAVEPRRSEADRSNRQLLSMASPAGDHFNIKRLGFGLGLCEALVRWFNHTTPTGRMQCPAQIVHSMQGITELVWEQLDIGEHEALFVKILEATRVGTSAYFRYVDTGSKSVDWLKPDRLEQVLAEARAGKWKLWMVNADIFPDPGGNFETIVRPEFVRDDGACLVEQAMTWFVTDDLLDIDRERSMNSTRAAGRMLLNYRGRPKFITVDIGDGAYVTEPVIDTRFRVSCEINNR
jgi:uncharacterized protein